MKDNKSKFPSGLDEHQKEQIIFIAKNSTPTQRFNWLLNALELMRKIGKSDSKKQKIRLYSINL